MTSNGTTCATLETIAGTIKACLRNISANIVEIGRQLRRAKSIVGHGGWKDWLDDNFGMTQQTAANYMRVAERFGKMKNVFQFQPAALIELAKLPPADTEKFLGENLDAAELPVRKLREKIKAFKATPAAEMNNLEPVTIDVSATSLKPVLSAVNAPKTHFQPLIRQISLFPNLPAIPAENQREYLPPNNMILAAKNIGAELIICRRAGHVPEISAPSIFVALGTLQASWIAALISKASALIQSRITFRLGDYSAAQKSCVILYFGDAPENFADAFIEFGAALSLTKQKAPTS